MTHGIAFTDALLLTDELTHVETVVLARWQDGLQRDDSYRQLAADLGVRPERVRTTISSLIDKNVVRVASGGKYRNSRRLVWIDPRLDRRSGFDSHFVLLPGPLVTRAVKAGRQGSPLRLRYLALLCRDQMRRGAAFTSDAEATKLLNTTKRSIEGARHALTNAGILVLHDRRRRQPIYVIPDAFVKPSIERFDPDLAIEESLARNTFNTSSEAPTYVMGSTHLRDGSAVHDYSTTTTTETTSKEVVSTLRVVDADDTSDDSTLTDGEGKDQTEKIKSAGDAGGGPERWGKGEGVEAGEPFVVYLDSEPTLVTIATNVDQPLVVAALDLDLDLDPIRAAPAAAPLPAARLAALTADELDALRHRGLLSKDELLVATGVPF